MPTLTPTEPLIAHCQSCGAEVPPDSDHCPSCGRLVRERSTKITVALTLLMIFAGVLLTQAFVNLHRTTEISLARRWFTRGEEAMQAKAPKYAAQDYRTALNYDQENDYYRLRLSEALLADNRLAEARAHLLSLWEEEPANGEVNLALARVDAKRGHYNDAVRYYNDAINGVWQKNPRHARTAARFELARYLLQQQQTARAQAELLALLADAPSDPGDLLLLGNMLLKVNEPAHALQAYTALLSKDNRNAQAWVGESQVYLALANYADAEHTAAKAVQSDPKLEDARQQLELTRAILRIDPALRGLTVAERTNRAAEAFSSALTRLSACAAQKNIHLTDSSGAAGGGNANPAVAPPNDLQLLYTSGLQKLPQATAQALRRDPDALEPAMQYVFEVERTTATICPNMDVTDRALLTLAQHENEAVK